MADFPYNFNAKQFLDFARLDDDDVNESFFEVNSENNEEDVTLKADSVEAANLKESSESIAEGRPEVEDPLFISPVRAGVPVAVENAYIHWKGYMRRSISENGIVRANKKHSTESVSDELSNGMRKMRINGPQRSSSKSSLTLQNARMKYSSSENINRLAQPKKKYSSADNLRSNEYVSLAQGVNEYLKKTPKRFHTMSKPLPFAKPKALMLTEGHTPKLTAKNRNRPIYFQTKEEQDMEEIKKFKIKAYPLNKKILSGPVKPQIEKKPLTKPEPFKLTAVKKSVPAAEPQPVQFHARPVPSTLHHPFKPVVATTVTHPQTPLCMKRVTQKPPSPKPKGTSPLKPLKLSTTKPVPFSFESRDKQLMKKKEELIMKTLEEEKRAREFRAQPVPPSVSAGKAFEPKCPGRLILEIEEFQLMTDRRAKEREEFEQKLKEKEEIVNKIKQERELLEIQRAEEERLRLRKEAEVKARPIIKYKELSIKPSLKVTDPITPKFETERRRNKENLCNNH